MVNVAALSANEATFTDGGGVFRILGSSAKASVIALIAVSRVVLSHFQRQFHTAALAERIVYDLRTPDL